ncbi:hypothetical protein L1049_009337 [Liquidambar formosana]|uniref:Uncharacterized protein n=1 Tax=Liquidambar formosana TaxID=63359 RepID=A0AAP0S942_LIQFO
MGESNIISNIMSMDLDAWDDPLSFPHSLVKLLSETDGQHGSLKIPSLWKVQSSNQSRFSFARQEDFENQHVPSKYSAPHGFMENKNPCVDECQNMFSPSSFAGPDNFPDSHSVTSSNQLCATRAHISTPPGFSVPRREPPPGFSLHGAYQAVNHSSVNHLLQTSLSPEGQFQTPSAGNVGSTGDVEFFDPAILEVGKGMLTTGLNNTGLDMRATLCPQFSPFEHEARLQLLMHQSVAAHQNVKFSDNFRKRFSPPNDSYGIPPMLVDQSQVSNPSPFTQLNLQQFRNAHTSNGHWNGWNENKHTSDLGISELLTNERLGFSNFISGYDDLKFQMPGSGNLYNRGFGM